VEAKIVSSLCEVGLDERGWNDLLATSQTNSVFQTHQWTRSWLTVFGDQCVPRFVTVSDESGTVGLAPLILGLGVSGERVIRFLGDNRADYCDFLTSTSKPQATIQLFEAILCDQSWDLIVLRNIPAHSLSARIASAICRHAGCYVLTSRQFVCPTLLIRGREEEARKILNKPSLRRREQYFRRAGHLLCRHLGAISEIEPHLDPFFAQHITRWTGSNTPSLFLDVRNRVFFRELAARLAPSGSLLFSVVQFDDKVIAYHYGFDYNGTVLWYKPSFDVTHARGSPGLVLLRQLIGYAIEQGRDELDFTIGDEPFKRRFTNSARATVQIRIYRSLGRFALGYCRRLLSSAVKSVARSRSA
jgi:CelD/BcsL family acetyltransferase involved in cellulose biosynthesis